MNQKYSDRNKKGDVCDNCPRVISQNQVDRDRDGDGVDDACDNAPNISR